MTGILAKAGGYKIKNHFKPNVFSKVRNRIAILTHFGRDAIDRAKMSAFNHLMDQRANQLGTTQIIKFDPSNEASVLHGSSILIFLLLFTLSWLRTYVSQCKCFLHTNILMIEFLELCLS